MMNSAEIEKYIKEKIGNGVGKLEVLKELFKINEKESKRKFIKRRVENFPTPSLEDDLVYKFLKWVVLIIISFMVLLSLISAIFMDPLSLISLLIGVLFLIHIYKNSLNSYHWLSVLNFIGIMTTLIELEEATKEMGELIGLMYLVIGMEVILLLFTMIIIYKYFRTDNKEWKKYVKENKL